MITRSIKALHNVQVQYLKMTRHKLLIKKFSHVSPLQPKDASVIVFPGQGSQYVGMGKELMRFPEARSIFQLANQILKYDILKLCLEGPKEKLDSTEFSQPAVMVCSLAALEKLREERPKAIENCVATAGFSLGEITALVFAGAIPFDKGVKLVQVRGAAMQAACDKVKSGMSVVVFGPDSNINEACSQAKQWCLERGVENPTCAIVNYLYPHCKVIGANVEALQYLETNAERFKIRRIKRIPVSGAFHTELMEPAVRPFTEALKTIYLSDPLVKVYSNVEGDAYKNVNHIAKVLPKQIIKPVKWEQILHKIYERKQGTDFPRTFEAGPGRGLTQILKRVNAKAHNSAFNIEA